MLRGGLALPTSGREVRLYVAGWKELSLVDVIGSVSFTLWLSYCNFKCPWCNNSRVARGLEKRKVRVDEVVERVAEAAPFIDYFHVTGGEPTLQLRALRVLYERVREETGLALSMDTNASIPEALRKIVDILDHVAVDVKAPLDDPVLYSKVIGLPVGLGRIQVSRVKMGLRELLGVPFLELRTTMVPDLIDEEVLARVVTTLKPYVEKAKRRVVYVVQQFIPYETIENLRYRGEKRTDPETVREAAKRAKEILGIETYYRTLEDGTVKL